MMFHWRHGLEVNTTAQLHSTKPGLRFCTGLNPAGGLLEIYDGENLWPWSPLGKRFSTFCQSIISQKPFIEFFPIIHVFIYVNNFSQQQNELFDFIVTKFAFMIKCFYDKMIIIVRFIVKYHTNFASQM